MPETLLKSATSFSVTRSFDATCDRVFDAWTKPERIKHWWGPAGFTTVSADVDLRPNGKYRIGIKSPEDELLYVTGRFVEVQKPNKLVFAWAWEEEEDASGLGHESLVTVEFRSRVKKTELVLTQERLKDAESRDAHVDGWTSSLEKLAGALSAPES